VCCERQVKAALRKEFDIISARQRSSQHENHTGTKHTDFDVQANLAVTSCWKAEFHCLPAQPFFHAIDIINPFLIFSLY
jgi:hypothetical protein